jgi:hypothetical protein
MSSDTRHLEPDEIAGYERRTLAPAHLLDVDDHLARCGRCRQMVADEARLSQAAAAIRRDLSTTGTVESVEHPTHEQFASYVDGDLESVEGELLEAHLEGCAFCAEDVADLRALRSSSSHWPRYVAAAGLAAGLAGVLFWQGTRPADSPDLEPVRASNPAAEPPASQPSTPPPLVTLDDGGARVALEVGGNLRGLPQLAGGEVQAVQRALQEGAVSLPPFIEDLGGSPGTLMAGPTPQPAFRPTRPVATAIEAERPVFEWTALPGATAYVASVFDRDFNLVAESAPLPETRWQPSAPLGRGQTYVWQVRAQGPDAEVVAPAPPSREARFLVLGQTEVDRLAEMRRRLGGSHLALGVLLAEAGVLDDAERELSELAAANPGVVEPGRLLEYIRARRAGR